MSEISSIASHGNSSTDVSQDIEFIKPRTKWDKDNLSTSDVLESYTEECTDDKLHISDAELSNRDDDEFKDAYNEFTLPANRIFNPHELTTQFIIQQFSSRTKPRDSLPVMKDQVGFSVWSFLKHCLGKDLTRVPMPITFNEPLSFTQRICEDLDYVEQLNIAGRTQDTAERLAYIAGFAASCYVTTQNRYSKPFNPLLGETFELISETMGVACLTEQTSHHPPMTAFHAEGVDWTLWGEVRLELKFRGQYCKVIPQGVLHLRTKMDGLHYSWSKPTLIIHNLILGNFWADHDGTLEIRCHNTGELATVVFTPHSKVGSLYKEVHGEVKNADGSVEYVINGRWDQGMSYTKVNSKTDTGAGNESHKLWTAKPPILHAFNQYGFTQLSLSLNEIDPETYLCSTDSRLRPDQRLLEEGNVDEASDTKYRLEEKQRRTRKIREISKLDYRPRWFVPMYDPDTKSTTYCYNGDYWICKLRQNFGKVPDIF
ncbi:Oxysterol-binding protein 1-like [Oopsacas minuta]|uniref:Oxysterol-binding protein n=1 Tax=Oopsacas minuta TaxID=111878 RepID=A0AAV7JYV6_9METZ|nr:Oxysterol-binding protein 1-like [Oopsacas minuta]